MSGVKKYRDRIFGRHEAEHGLFEAEHGLFEAEHVGGYRRGIEAPRPELKNKKNQVQVLIAYFKYLQVHLASF